jgi:GntR family L-lactate dehydrogenase operon transcriptional regulator
MLNVMATPVSPPVAGDEAAVLEAVAQADGPIGCRQITSQLHARGLSLSESTVSRLLRKLDSRDLTRPANAKGRLLTAAGRRQLDDVLATRRRRSTNYLDIRTIQDLLDLLVARRAIERETARAAAVRIENSDLEQLRALVESQRDAIAGGGVPREVATRFHRTIATASGNKLLGVMADLVFDPALDPVAAVLDVIVGSHSSESASIPEHLEIVEALAARDPDRAERAMLGHVDRLIAEVEAFRSSGGGDAVIDRVVAWMAGEASAYVRRG